MGHAHLDNLSRLFVRRLYAKGKLSIAEAQEAASKAGETLHASEGEHTESFMIRMGLEDVIRFLATPNPNLPRKWRGPVIEPVELTEEQADTLDEFMTVNNGEWDCGDDGNGGRYGIFDAIEWRFCSGWRKHYPDGIPVLGSVTH